MYKRFLNDKDYLAVITKDQLDQVVRDVHDRIPAAEQSAEMCIREYLDQYYEVEKELEKGKAIKEYSEMFNYPANVYFKKDDKIYRTLSAIRGYKKPDSKVYWKMVDNTNSIKDIDNIKPYLQIQTYSPGEVVLYCTDYWQCVTGNGCDYNNIQIPGLKAWVEVVTNEWQTMVDYELNAVVTFDDKFYVLIKKDDNYNNEVNPIESEYWGQIGDYSEEYEYDVESDVIDYVVRDGKVYKPTINPNAEKLIEGENIVADDPRNLNLVKHMTSIAMYYMFQAISPTNISDMRRIMFEDSMDWLLRASKLKINPQIPRKIDCDGKTKVDWATATFQTDFNVDANPWII